MLGIWFLATLTLAKASFILHRLHDYICAVKCNTIGVRAGGRGGRQPPQFQKFRAKLSKFGQWINEYKWLNLKIIITKKVRKKDTCRYNNITCILLKDNCPLKINNRGWSGDIWIALLLICWSLAFAEVRANFEATRKVKGRFLIVWSFFVAWESVGDAFEVLRWL